ncbi:MAG: hypothetical protein AAGG48_14680 [Planctomycetota bacterium]
MKTSRWKAFNELVDGWFPILSNAECQLLVYYYRHAELKGKNVKRMVFKKSDGTAANDVGKSRQQVTRIRQSLVKKGAVGSHKFTSGKVWWFVCEPPEEVARSAHKEARSAHKTGTVSVLNRHAERVHIQNRTLGGGSAELRRPNANAFQSGGTL